MDLELYNNIEEKIRQIILSNDITKENIDILSEIFACEILIKQDKTITIQKIKKT